MGAFLIYAFNVLAVNFNVVLPKEFLENPNDYEIIKFADNYPKYLMDKNGDFFDFDGIKIEYISKYIDEHQGDLESDKINEWKEEAKRRGLDTETSAPLMLPGCRPPPEDLLPAWGG